MSKAYTERERQTIERPPTIDHTALKEELRQLDAKYDVAPTQELLTEDSTFLRR